MRLRTGWIALAVGGMLLVSCGDDEGDQADRTTRAPSVTDASPSTADPATTGPASTEPVPTPAATATTPAPTTAQTPAPTDAPTTVPDTVPPSTEPDVPWSETAADDLDAILASVTDGTGTADVIDRFFATPIDLDLPDDGALNEAYVTVVATEEGLSTSWRISVATMEDPADLEAAIATEFADDRFASGARVESTLDSGVFVTLNYPPTEIGTDDGWKLLSLTVGPDTGSSAAPGRQELQISVEQVTPAAEPQLPQFLVGWVREMPLTDDLEFSRFEANLVRLSTPGVWMDIEFTAPAASFAELIDFYAQDLSSGALDLESSSRPTDLTTLERFSAGFFPTLAGYPLFVIVERDLTAADADVVVTFEVRMEPAS